MTPIEHALAIVEVERATATAYIAALRAYADAEESLSLTIYEATKNDIAGYEAGTGGDLGIRASWAHWNRDEALDRLNAARNAYAAAERARLLAVGSLRGKT